MTATATRAATRHATYQGDVESIVGELKGPNELGEFLTAVEAEYNPATNTTRVGFAYATRDEVDAMFAAVLMGAIQ